jgi:hypothetical protein
MEGSVLGLVVGAWLWVILTLGAHHAMVTQLPPPSDGEHLPGYEVIACPGAQSPEEGVGSVGGGDSGASGCLREVRSHMSTSRQPGASLTEQQGHPADH